MGMGVAVSMAVEAPRDDKDGPPVVAVKATPSLCMALASASAMSARTTVRINPLVALNVLNGVSCNRKGEKIIYNYLRAQGRRMNRGTIGSLALLMATQHVSSFDNCNNIYLSTVILL